MPGKRGGPLRNLRQLKLDPELALQLQSWMDAENISSDNYSEAIRSLMRIAMAATPQEGALYAARLRAYNEVRLWTLKRVAHATGDILRELRASLESEGI
jgi:hypothetical protein